MGVHSVCLILFTKSEKEHICLVTVNPLCNWGSINLHWQTYCFLHGRILLPSIYPLPEFVIPWAFRIIAITIFGSISWLHLVPRHLNVLKAMNLAGTSLLFQHEHFLIFAISTINTELFSCGLQRNLSAKHSLPAPETVLFPFCTKTPCFNLVLSSIPLSNTFQTVFYCLHAGNSL